jgi:hypothetical protein
VKLYELPRAANPRPKIFGLAPDGDEDGWVEFDHIDGMYSYCVAYTSDGEELGVCHLAAWTPLEAVEGGYIIAEEEDPDVHRP